MRRAIRSSGVALIEVIVFMVVVATAVGALLSVFAGTNRGSAELLLNRQALALAEGMLNEVLAAPFTICDPNDTGITTGACVTPPESVVGGGGPEAGETRLGLTPPSLSFDNVNDYNNLSIPIGAGIANRAGISVPGSDAYSLRVTVIPVNIVGAAITANQMLLVTVSVDATLMHGPVVLQGMRSRYAPQTSPL